MALKLSYNTIQEQYRAAKPVTGGVSENAETSAVAGNVTITVPQLQPVSLPMTDVSFQTNVKVTQKAKDQGLVDLGLTRDSGGIVNNNNKPTLLINANRVVLNSKEDYTMIFGQAGVAIASPNKVNIDADQSITLFGKNNLYLGIPAKGDQSRLQEKNPLPGKKATDGTPLKSSPTKDFPYEPIPLGIKLTNWLEDLLQVLKNAVLLTPVGRGYFREDTQYDFIALQARLNEILSTYAFIDGYSHERVDVNSIPSPPPTITEPPTSITGDITGTITSTDSEAIQETFKDDLENLPGYGETINTSLNTK